MVLCKVQFEENEKLIDQQSKMLLIVPVPADSIPTYEESFCGIQ